MSVVGALQVDTHHNLCKIRQIYARIQRRKRFIRIRISLDIL
jgi:hypothetical protein